LAEGSGPFVMQNYLHSRARSSRGTVVRRDKVLAEIIRHFPTLGLPLSLDLNSNPVCLPSALLAPDYHSCPACPVAAFHRNPKPKHPAGYGYTTLTHTQMRARVNAHKIRIHRYRHSAYGMPEMPRILGVARYVRDCRAAGLNCSK